MKTQLRVHELARELGVKSHEVLTELAHARKFVKSASSTIDAEAEAFVRRRLQAKGRQRPAPVHRPVVPRGPHFPRREWYRGNRPQPFTKRILDDVIVHRQAGEYLPPSGYFQDEVDRASKLAQQWKGCLLEGLTQDQCINWIRLGRVC